MFYTDEEKGNTGIEVKANIKMFFFAFWYCVDLDIEKR